MIIQIIRVLTEWIFGIILPCLPSAILITIPLIVIFNLKIVKLELKHKRA